MNDKENNDSFALDNSAEELYRKFSGMDAAKTFNDKSSQSALVELLNQEENMLDYYRFLLAQATCLFAGILYNSLFAILDQENDQKIKVFINTLKRIAKFPKFDGKIFCRLRGQQFPSEKAGSEAYDYELSFGNFLLDYQVARIVEERRKDSGKDIYAKLMEAFKGLSTMDIFNFSIDIGSGGEEDYRKLEDTIRYLVKFHHKNTDRDKYIVCDEYGQPNINLTVLAAANKVQPAALQNLVNKIKPLMLGPNSKAELKNFTTVYDVILASKRYREQLKKMPIEVNNVEWLTQARYADPKRKTDNVKASRLVLSKYGSNLKMAAEVLTSINSEGYSDIRTEVMGKRLTLATEFLNIAEKSEDKQNLQNEALHNIEEGMDQVQDETYDSISIVENEVSTVDEEGRTTEWTLHETILGLLSFFKRRSTIKKKVRDIANSNVRFDDEDYAVIAKNFKITEQQAAHLISLLKACFDEMGNFRRNSFEKNIPEFVRYEGKVFEFLWHYLKELSTRPGRVSFLNALQILIAQLKQPQNVLKILLKDIFNRTSVVNFSDRNGLMLGTILLRHHNREERSNIELTPEEVLLVRKGLNREMVAEAMNFLEQNKEKVIQKIKRITDLLLTSAAQAAHNEGDMQPRFLLYLKRELVIFLALTGGELAQSIIRGVVKEFGNPGSSYYREMKNKDNLRYTMQLLQTAVRALRRFYDPLADEMFDEITGKEALFVNLYDAPAHSANVKKMMARIRQPD